MSNQFSIFLIGEGTLPIQCAEILLEKEHQILGIISPNKLIGDWAKEKGIAHIHPNDCLPTFLSRHPFDYLFSIVNHVVLPREILDLPRQGAINYHDAPLPRYAGTNATAWALMQREKTHGVTWHRMSNVIDGGDILKQVAVGITKGETALTLNSKCYEAAIHSFAQLIDELAAGKAVAFLQNLNERTYFPPSKRLNAGGLLSFKRCAHELDAVVRAVDFGSYPNPLGLAKFAVGNDLIIVSQLDVRREQSQLLPGTITAIQPEFLRIATSSYEIELRQLQTLDGRSRSIPDVVKTFGLQVGYRFSEIEPELVARIESFDRSIVKHEAFWVERLANLQPLVIPYAEQQSLSAAVAQYAIVKMPIPDEVRTFLAKCHSTWNAADFLLAAIVGYLARISGSDCFDLGFRDVELERELVGTAGLFADCVPCHLEVDFQQGFEAILATVRAQVALTKQQKTYARDVVVRYPVLRSLPELASEQLFSVVIERVEKLDDRPASSGKDLTFIISADGTECGWFYNTKTLNGECIANMIEQFTIFLQGILADASQRLAYLPLLSQEERHKILVEWNNTQTDYRNKCIHQLFEEQVERTPDAVAVVFENEQLTYRELNNRANKLAHYLQKLGVSKDVLVGLYAERSLAMVVGIWGILKAGGAYVPLDPAYPQDRVAYILADAQVKITIGDAWLLASLLDNRSTVVALDTNWAEIEQQPQSNPVTDTQPDNLIYVIYTSGSTGHPKGVEICHQSQANLLNHLQHSPGLTSTDTLLAVTTICFDTSTVDMYLPLVLGAKIVLVSSAIAADGFHLSAQLTDSGATFLQATPASFQLLLAAGWKGSPHLRVISTGEALPHNLADLLLDKVAELWDLYGPTETTVWSTSSKLNDLRRIANDAPGERLCQRVESIGKPISNTQTYILDRSLQPVPIGIFGELYIGGDGLAKGYLNRPELTAEKFIPNPFGAGKLYQTGDLVRYLPDGNIEYLGRIDNQVKIRGFRIELGEIEAVLSQHPAVVNAVAIVREDSSGDKHLVVYISVQDAATLSQSQLRQFLQQQLPDYLIPSAFVVLANFPLTPNGKIDRHALPIPDSEISQTHEYVAPRTASEEIIANIFASVLNVQKIGIHDNFFELGGHSLLATQLISQLRLAFSIEISLQVVFESPTVARFEPTLTQLRTQQTGFNIPTIEPIADKTLSLPLSFAQQRLWFLDRLEGSSATYNIPTAFRIAGNLDARALQQALAEIVRRHQVLRTSFQMVDGSSIQIVDPAVTLEIQVVDLQQRAVMERESVLQELVQQEILTPFDLETAPLIRCSLFQLAAAEYVLLLTIHHIVADGWSIGVLIRELTVLYTAFSEGTPSPLSELRIQYADFAVWQRQFLSEVVLETQLNYWQKQLQGAPALLQLPTDRTRPSVQTYRGATQSFTLGTDLTQQLQLLSRQSGTTLFMTLQGAFATLLHRYSGQTDIVIGSPIANRNRSEIESSIGLFVNTLVLRTWFDDNLNFTRLLAQIRATTLQAYEHQDIPFERVVEVLKPQRSLSHSPLFQVMFVLQNTPIAELTLPGITLTELDRDSPIAKFDLTLSMSEIKGGLIGTWEYNADLFNDVTIERMNTHFQNLLSAIVENPQQFVDELPLLNAAERHQLVVEWNDTASEYPRDKCIHQLFERQVERTPDAVAVVFEDQQLTYQQLNHRANQLAHHLHSLGVKPELLVGICVERSLEMVVGLLGILKAGGAYVPLDSSYPMERLSYMLADAGVAVLLTQQTLFSSLGSVATPVICLDTDWEIIDRHDRDNLTPGLSLDNLAYVIYTSGSTGQPKGAMNTHRGILNRLLWMQDTYPLTSSDRVLQKTPFGFDVSVWEFFWPLLAGARIVVAKPEGHKDSNYLVDLIARSQITTIHFVPPMLQVFLQERGLENCQCLQRVFCSGEALPFDLTERFFERFQCELHNLYGPTEAAIDVSFWQCQPHDNRQLVPIGRPIANTQLYILDRHFQPVPIGVVGELYIGGDGLGRGYLNRPELTAEKFSPNPFSPNKSTHLYKTGDLARYLADGNIEFLGRIDNQVKIRGFRIELGEIESVLSQHPDVVNAIAIVYEDAPGDKRLIAYVIPQPSATLTQTELRQFLNQKLPDYMLPAAFVVLDSFPLTPNGKIDRHALPAPDRTQVASAETFVAPRNELEQQLAKIWSELLKIQSIGIEDNFFALGGHSLLATQVMSRIQTFYSLSIPLRYIFEYPTIAQLGDSLGTLIINRVPMATNLEFDEGQL